MGYVTDKGADVYRDFKTAGVPASGANEPAKYEIRSLFSFLDGALAQLLAGFIADQAVVVYAARSSLYANLAPADRSLGLVYNDGANNGLYIKNGAAGSGSWNTTGLMLEGQAGRAATVAVGSVSGGDAASVVNAGSASDAILNFVLPRGKSFLQTAIDTGYVPVGTTEAQLNDKIVGQITAAAVAARDAAAASASDARADRTQTGLDRTQTGQDKTAAAGSATAAASTRTAIATDLAGKVVPITITASNRVIMAGLNPATLGEGTTVQLGEGRRAGLFAWRTGNFSAMVAADPLEGVYVAHLSIPASSGVFERVGKEVLSPYWWGYVSDALFSDGSDNVSGRTDNYPALQAMLNYDKAMARGQNKTTPAGALTIWPRSSGFCSQTLNIKHVVNWLGLSNGVSGGGLTEIVFPANVFGIIVHRADTMGSSPAAVAGTTGADGAYIRGIFARADRAGAVESSNACGFWLRARGTLDNCGAESFALHGMMVRANDTIGSPTFAEPHGNANSSLIRKPYCTGNGRNGVDWSGYDGNAGALEYPDCTNNGGYPWSVRSFLPNATIRGGHAAANGQLNTGLYPDTSIVWHETFMYYTVRGSNALWPTTTPGTNNAVWRRLQDGAGGLMPGVAAPYPGIPQWVQGGSYCDGGSGLIGGSTWHDAPYNEGTSGPYWLCDGASKISGGILASGFDHDPTGFPGVVEIVNQGIQKVTGKQWLTSQPLAGRTLGARHVHDVGEGIVYEYRDSLDVNVVPYQFCGQVASGVLYDTYNRVKITTRTGPTPPDTALLRMGRSKTQAYLFAAQKLAIGNRSQNLFRQVWFGNGAPTEFDNAPGEITFQQDPGTMKAMAFMCIDGGGTGKVGVPDGTGTHLKAGALFIDSTVASYDPPSLAPGTSGPVQTTTVTGALVGDRVSMTFTRNSLGIRLEAWVSATNTVSFFPCNPAGNPGGTIDLAASTLYVRVERM